MDLQPELYTMIKQEMDLQDIEDKINECYHPNFDVDVKIESEDNEEDWCLNSYAETSGEVHEIDIKEESNLDLYEPSLNSENYCYNNQNFDIDEPHGVNFGFKAKHSNLIEGSYEDTRIKISLSNNNATQSDTYLLRSDFKDDLMIDIQENNPNNKPDVVACQNIALTFQCKDCTITFDNDDDLLEHIRAIHGSKLQNQNKGVAIKKISKVINLDTDDEQDSIENMIGSDVKTESDKIASALPKKQYTCAVCKEIFCASESANNDYKCKKCTSNTTEMNAQTSSSDNEDCLVILDKKKPKKYQMHTCKICKKTFKYKHWHAHMRQVHGPGSYACMPCKMEFKCARYLKKHIMFKHEGVPRSYERNKPEDGIVKCSLCPKTFKNSDNLSHHVQNCHGEPVQCDICHCTVKSKSYLQSHKRRIHVKGVQKFYCPICSKGLKSQEQVGVHIKKCHNDKTETCKYCHRAFKCKQYLMIHLRRCPMNTDRDKQSDKIKTDEFVDVET